MLVFVLGMENLHCTILFWPAYSPAEKKLYSLVLECICDIDFIAIITKNGPW